MREKAYTAVIAAIVAGAVGYLGGNAQQPEPAEAQRGRSAVAQLQEVNRRLGRVEDKLVQNGRALVNANRDRDELLNETNDHLSQISANTSR